MNRHHPYGGPYDGPRRGGPAGNFGPGPDRSHRFDRGGAPRGRGYGRGRGGNHGSYGGYGNTAPYDQGPPQGDMGGYNNYYQSGPPQDQYYQNGNYAAPAPGPGPGQYNAPDSTGGYDQSFEYEDGQGQNYNQGGNNGRFQKRPQRRERDDKVHDSIIEERIQRERPCRTLFIRNIKYETNSTDVRRLFEEHGEIKTFFDLIANRGMVFVTYYDLRAAERARDRLQGSEISGRPIDVHYSLPRDDHGKGADRQREQELQGTLLVTLRNSATNQPIDDEEVRRKFQQFGDVKSVRPAGDRPDQRFVEFYDTRASEEAHDRLRHQGLQDGVMEIVFAYSGTDDPRGPSSPHHERDDRGGFDRQRDWDEHPGRGRRGGRGGRGRGRGYGGDDSGGRRDWNKDRDRSRPFEDEFGRAQRGGSGEFNSNDRYGHKNGSGGYGGPGPSSGYGAPPANNYGQASTAPAEAADERERLEQAKKVQQLLAALKQPQSAGSAPPAAAPAAPPSAPPAMPQMPPAPPPPVNPYYSQPPMSMPPQASAYPPNAPPAPSANPYSSMPSHSSTPQPTQGTTPAPPMAGLPPNILALLQQSTQSQQSPTQLGAPPPMPPYSMPPASALISAQQSQQQQQQPHPMSGLPPPNPSQPGYQQLMAYLQSQKR
ncbi:hypothetical protein C8Q70DRAFT_59571 [Cubamyces menziesii]|nr:hypothetical protein C8Q70DRAFT_59571 [Cubamyces menziesii]